MKNQLQLHDGAFEASRLVDLQRQQSLRNRVNGVPVVQNFDGKFELRFFLHSQWGDLDMGVHNVEVCRSPDTLMPSDLDEKVSIWLMSRGVGVVPANCAEFLCFENSEKAENSLFIPDEEDHTHNT